MKPPPEIPKQNHETIVPFLNLLLANEYVLYTKTRTAHWNIVSENHFEWHVFLENQFNTIDIMIDDIAEHIRSLGYFALGSLTDFLSIAQTADENYSSGKSKEISETLRKDHETITGMIQQEIASASYQSMEHETATLLADLMEKHRYMIKKLRFLSANPVYTLSQQITMNSSMLMDLQE